MDYILYGNGASGNHGCEAIIRGSSAVLKGHPTVLSGNVQEDRQYGIGEIASVFPAITGKKRLHEQLSAYLRLKTTGDYVPMDGIAYLDAIRQARGRAKLAVSVGGDNYCYGDTGIYEYLNKAYHKYGFQTALWGCSIEPDVVPKITEDLNRYGVIVARESITYAAIRQVCDHVIQAPDPAFFMDYQEWELPKQFEKPVIGINVSPMIVSYEKNSGMTYQNCCRLIDFILKETDYNVALIPHVVWQQNDDRTVLNRLYQDFNGAERIALIGDHTAPKLKYLISKCDCFIGARTHATIAAYSTAVPTMVVGYSVKSRGIARDLFGAGENYVLPVQALDEPNQLKNEFVKLLEKKETVKSHLQNLLPQYKLAMQDAVKAVSELTR